MAIGITQVLHLQMMRVGPDQKAVSQSTTHAQQVGVFPMVATMVSGQRPLGGLYLSTTSHYITPPTEV
jgi:hypothetical protein